MGNTNNVLPDQLIYCKQLKTFTTFQSAFNKNTFSIRHNVTCKSSCVNYLIKCCVCEKSQCVGKSECNLNLRINTRTEIMFGEQMVNRVTNIFKITGHNFTLSLISSFYSLSNLITWMSCAKFT